MSFRVLLCCIEPRTPSVAVTEGEISSFFSGFGPVKLVAIFSRKPSVKAFVEFENPESAKLAIESCKAQDSSLGRLQLTVSKKALITSKPPGKSLDLSNSANVSSKDFTGSSERQNSHASHKLPSHEPDSRLTPVRSKNFSQFYRSAERRKVEGSSSSSIEAKPAEPPRAHYPPHPAPSHLRSGHLADLPPGRPDESAAHRVLILHKATNPRLTTRGLANVFGCFGNVLKVLINHRVKYALVEMETEMDARNALACLDGQFVLGAPLKVRLSHYPSLSLTSLDKSAKPDFEFLVEEASNHRFEDLNRSQFLPPSPGLYLAIAPRRMTTEILLLLINTVAAPVRVASHTPALARVAFVLEFSNKASCFDVIAELQNVLFDDQKLHFSFLNQHLT